MPAGTGLYGEVWTRLLATGAFFSDASAPKPVLQIGASRGQSEYGRVQLADLMLSNSGPIPGAILLQWNLAPGPAGAPGDCGMWDVHYRVGGFDGSGMPPSLCTTAVALANARDCYGAHTLFHVTETGSVYVENTWGWVADHDIDLGTDNNIFNARGFVSTSSVGPVWLYGTAMEHSYLLQYNLHGVSNHFMGVIQTETPYFQPQQPLVPLASDPEDPTYGREQTHAYALAAFNSTNLVVYGTGLYSFFNNWSTADCGGSLAAPPCQQVLVRFDAMPHHSVSHASLDHGVRLHNVNTHGAATVILVNGVNISAANSVNGFCQTVSDWS